MLQIFLCINHLFVGSFYKSFIVSIISWKPVNCDSSNLTLNGRKIHNILEYGQKEVSVESFIIFKKVKLLPQCKLKLTFEELPNIHKNLCICWALKYKWYTIFSNILCWIWMIWSWSCVLISIIKVIPYINSQCHVFDVEPILHFDSQTIHGFGTWKKDYIEAYSYT